MKKPKLNRAVKITIVAIIIFLASGFITGYICGAVSRSDYFKIKDIITRDGKAEELSYLKGKNIFSVDLKQESGYLLQYFPDCSNIRLVRVLPCRIFVDFIKRKPVAFVKLYRYFSVDDEGVLFYLPNQSQESGLPVILGLETKIFGPKPGRRYNIKELTLALNVIKQVKSNKALKNYNIRKIDVGSFASASMFINLAPKTQGPAKGKTAVFSQGLEVRLGADNIKDKIGFLAGLMSAEKNDLSNIKYIDLRFKEPVVKFKDK